MRHRNTLLAAGTALVMLTGVTAASAAGSDAGQKSPASHAPAKPGHKKPGPGKPGKPAGKDFGVPADRLERGLRDVKQLVGIKGAKVTDPAVVAVFAKDLGVSTAQARKILTEIFGTGPIGPKKPGGKGDKGGKPGNGKPGGPAAVFTAQDLAKALGVPLATAQTALNSLQKLAQGPKGSIDPNSPAFAAIAAKAGVTPQQLVKAITQLKIAADKPGAPKS